MSSRLFKHQMATNNRPPRYPMLFVGTDVSPFQGLYLSKPNAEFIPLAKIVDASATVNCVAYTPDGKYMAMVVSNNTSATLMVYSREGNTFKKLTVAGNFAVSFIHRMDFTPDGEYLFVTFTHVNAVTTTLMFKRNADKLGYTRTAPTTAFPVEANYGIAVSRGDGEFVAIGNATGCKVYQRSGSTFTQLTIPFIAQPHHDLQWSADNQYLIAALYVGGSVATMAVYKRVGTTFTKHVDTAGTYVVSAVRTIAISPDGQHIAMGGIDAPYLAVMKFNGTTLTRLATVSALPGVPYDLAFSEDGQYLIAGHQGTNVNSSQNNFTVLKRTGDTYAAITTLTKLGTASNTAARAVAMLPPGA